MFDTVSAWGSETFAGTLKASILTLDIKKLPLQNALVSGHYVSENPFDVMIIHSTETKNSIVVQVGIFFQGVISGCNCADDPGPDDAMTNEYGELQFTINRLNGEFEVVLAVE